MYETAQENGSAAQKIYTEQLPCTVLSDLWTFESLPWELCASGHFMLPGTVSNHRYGKDKVRAL